MCARWNPLPPPLPNMHSGQPLAAQPFAELVHRIDVGPRMKPSRFVMVALVVIASYVPSACNRANVHQTVLRNVPNASGSPKILADYQPWFGDPNHIDVGYNSQDPKVLREQINNARNMGIYAFVVDWYGPRQPFLDRSYAMLQRIASEERFHVALMYDETQED